MRYVVRSCYLIDTATAELDHGQFEHVRACRRSLVAGYDLEDLFDILLSNYLRIESACLDLAVEKLVQRSATYLDRHEERAPINLAFINFLSTARMYVDQLGQKASRCLEVNGQSIDCKALLSREHDSSFAYRFMEALRNYVQHSGTAVHTLTHGFKKIERDSGEPYDNSVYVAPFCNKRFLQEEGSFKARVLRECPESINLLMSVREYVRGISRVHKEVRGHVKPALSAAKGAIEAIRRLLEGKTEASGDALEAVSLNDKGEVVVSVPLLLNWDEVRGALASRNHGLPSAGVTYANGEGLRDA